MKKEMKVPELLKAIKSLITKENINHEQLGMTPLMYALQERSGKEIIEFLINNGANVNLKNSSNQTPLMIAVRDNNDKDVVQLLLSKGANIHDKDDDQWTPLVYAIMCNNKSDIIDLLRKQEGKSTRRL